jgi:heptose-I-phosphate ethanolaminephosphotransferase
MRATVEKNQDAHGASLRATLSGATAAGRPGFVAAGPALAATAISAGTFLFLLQGHTPMRAMQLLLLLLPGVLVLLLPARTRLRHRLRLAFVTIWVTMFLLDGAVCAFLLETYGAALDSAFVTAAVANTSWRESSEYARTFKPVLAGWAVALAFCVPGALAFASLGNRSRRPSSAAIVLLGALLALSSLAYVSKPWRKFHPAVFWTSWGHTVTALRDNWQRQEAVRARGLQLAAGLRPVVVGDRPSTVVLVLGESINRDNMSLYGYARATTPALDRLKQELGDSMLVFRNAWSVEASTLPSLEQLFALDKDNDDGEDPHIVALARAAGYRTWWISNQDDIAIDQLHARQAEVVENINRSPGSSGGGLDEHLLDKVQAALADGARRKFIVVHLMGAHTHYRLRYPNGADAFVEKDAVDLQMRAAGRSWRVGMQRKEYDSAVRYHDTVLARLLDLVRAGSPQGGEERRALMYLSDHGQEVGHSADFSGHSRTTPAGYRIPAFIWHNRPGSIDPGVGRRAFRSDWASWVVADLLQLDWRGRETRYNVLSPDYRWQAPKLPVAINAYTE